MKIFSNLILAIALLALPFISDAQQRNCSTMEHHEHQLEINPDYQRNLEKIEKFTEEFVANYDASTRNVITIPVVVHVVYRTNAENISDAQVLSQIDVLNEDFRRTNSDANNKWSQAADTQIEFCMATVDPDGNPTDGINRVQTGKRSFRTNDDVKKTSKGGVNPWDTQQYLNIWVCNLANGILGYAQFPGGSRATDGVVCLYNAFGRVGTLNSTYNLGRTTTHEVGHWLNLRHIWGDGGCSVDDFVSDTPTSDGANYGCATGHVSCGTEDMVQNYMDYSDDGCMNLFTAGQSARMAAVLAPGGYHYNLTQSTTCSGGGDNGGGGDPDPTPTCDDNIQNGNETGVDCGGPDCPSCDTGGGTGGSCDVPAGLYSTSRKGGREARLSWDAASGANSYTVQLRQAGAASWNEAAASGTSIDATGLTKGASYEWQVRSNCSNETSAWASSTFVAGQSGRLSSGFADVFMYPNPASNHMTIEVDMYGSNDSAGIVLNESAGEMNDNILVNVINSLGQTVTSFSLNGQDIIELNTSNYTNGMYFIQLSLEDGTSQTERFIVRK